jgi:predicted amidohydrolase YtcJ
VRNELGELTGLLQERAASMVRSAGPRRPEPPEAETLAAYRAGFLRYLSRGITSAHVAGTSLSSAAMLERARTDDLPLRLYIMLREGSLDDAGQRKRSGDARDSGIRYGAIKLFHGNSLSGQTCWLSKPYENRPDYFGVPPARSQEALNQLILRVHDAGLQACVHSNGDREIEMVLNAFEHALKQQPADEPSASHRALQRGDGTAFAPHQESRTGHRAALLHLGTRRQNGKLRSRALGLDASGAIAPRPGHPDGGPLGRSV